MSFAFLVHPLIPLQQRFLGVRRGHLPLAIGRSAGIEAVGHIGEIQLLNDTIGHIIALPGLPEDLASDQQRTLAHLISAARMAETAGAKVIGLGSALAVVAGRGEALAEHIALPVTTGHASTAWTCAQITQSAYQKSSEPRGPIGILGFRGTVGDAVAQMLSREAPVWADARGPADVRRAEQLGVRPVELSELLRTCRWIVGASTTGPLLSASQLRPGTHLIDLALPPTVRDAAPHIRVSAGEALFAPGLRSRSPWTALWLRFANYGKDCVFACLAEPAAMSLLGENDWSRGRRLTRSQVERAGHALTELGFSPRVS